MSQFQRYGTWHKKLSSTGAGTDTDVGTDTGVIDNMYGC